MTVMLSIGGLWKSFAGFVATRDVSFELLTGETHAVIGLVSAGLGVALVPASARKIGLAGVTYRPMREATPLACVAIARRRTDTSPVVAAFLEVAHRVAGQVDSAHALRR